MRTDSVNLADEALTEIRHYIENKIGKEYLPSAAKQYKTKSKNAQEAHEAIRPTSVYRTPESVKPFLSADQFKLYQMIWQRTVACQMTPAKFDQTTVDITVGKGVFRVTGQVQTFAGFLSVYEESSDDEESEDGKKLPEMSEGDKLPVDKLYGEQHSPLRRRATTKPHWLKPLKNTASTAPRPTPASSPRSKTANTLPLSKNASCPPTQATSSINS